MKISQKVWPDLENHKLNTVAQALGIALNHHEAGSDAHACGEILQHALRQTGCVDAIELAEKIGLQLGHISPQERRGCSSTQKTQSKIHSRSKHHHKKVDAHAISPQQRKEGIQ